MPPPSLGRLYRVTEMVRYLEGQPRKMRSRSERTIISFKGNNKSFFCKFENL